MVSSLKVLLILFFSIILKIFFQYGFIYNTLRNLVVEKFGEEKWIEIW